MTGDGAPPTRSAGVGGDGDDGGRPWAVLLAGSLLAVLVVGIGTFVVVDAWILGIGCACQETTPTVLLDHTYDPASGTVTLTHAGGNDLTTDNTGRLEVVVEGEVKTTWSLPVELDDRVTVEASPGDRVDLVWTAPGERETQVIESVETSEED